MRPSIHEARDRFVRRATMAFHYGDVAAGIPFEWGLFNSDGAWFRLLVRDETPDQIRTAKAHLRRTRDVVSIKIERCP